MFICVYVYVVGVRLCVCLCLFVCICMCTSVCVFAFACMFVLICVYVYVYVCVCVRVRARACVCVCLYDRNGLRRVTFCRLLVFQPYTNHIYIYIYSLAQYLMIIFSGKISPNPKHVAITFCTVIRNLTSFFRNEMINRN